MTIKIMNLASNCTYLNAKKLNAKLQLTAKFDYALLYYAYFTYVSFNFRPRNSIFYSVNDLKQHGSLVNIWQSAAERHLCGHQ